MQQSRYCAPEAGWLGFFFFFIRQLTKEVGNTGGDLGEWFISNGNQLNDELVNFTTYKQIE